MKISWVGVWIIDIKRVDSLDTQFSQPPQSLDTYVWIYPKKSVSNGYLGQINQFVLSTSSQTNVNS